VVLRVGIPGHAVLLLPDGNGLQVKRVTGEQIRRAESVEIPVIDQRAGLLRPLRDPDADRLFQAATRLGRSVRET
jgi:hypothetical protein